MIKKAKEIELLKNNKTEEKIDALTKLIVEQKADVEKLKNDIKNAEVKDVKILNQNKVAVEVVVCKSESKGEKLEADIKKLLNDKEEVLKRVDGLKKENDEFKKQLVKPTKTIINNNQTYNISVQNQIIQTYSKAPILQALDDYEVLDKYDEDEDSNIIEKLINNQKKNSLAKFLGDFIITIYKKDDPTEQSLWSSDTARLTYVIRELMAGKNKKKQRFQWNKDAKAIKTAEYIIVPMLEYITYHIDEYRKIHDEYLKSGVFEKAQKYRDIYEILGEIEVNSDNGILKKQIIRYITPYFQFNNGTKLIK